MTATRTTPDPDDADCFLTDVDDTDWNSPPCTAACPCPRCRAADADEPAVLARLGAADEWIDLGALWVASLGYVPAA